MASARSVNDGNLMDMPRKRKTATQLDRDIASSLSRSSTPRRRHHALIQHDVSFHDLVREDDPSAMDVAEDLLLTRGQTLREATGGFRARNFTIEMKPMWGPREAWKMVQTSVYEDGKGKLSVANGSSRVYREYKKVLSKDSDEARRRAVATAWAVAKAIKPLPMDVDEKALAKIVDEIVARGNKNMRPKELF